jgi:hypothetical protein
VSSLHLTEEVSAGRLARSFIRPFHQPHKLTPHQRQEALSRREKGESLTSTARGCNVHHATIGRL